MFQDDNQNGALDLDLGEVYLADGNITIQDSEGTEVGEYTTDGESEPFCIEDLEAGRYTVHGVEPRRLRFNHITDLAR